MSEVDDMPPTDLVPIPAEVPPSVAELVIARAPEVVLEEAHRAAAALKDVLDTKPKKVIFNGSQYLEYEDWQTLGRFYGVTAKVVSTAFVEYAEVKGFSARAVALRADGAEISAAEAECLNDESNWRRRPLFMLKSMAQTRACAKCLRNVLAWVVVLAGYRPTPAEELPLDSPAPTRREPQLISKQQQRKLFAVAKAKSWPITALREMLLETFNAHRSTDVTTAQFDHVLARLEQGPPVAPADQAF